MKIAIFLFLGLYEVLSNYRRSLQPRKKTSKQDISTRFGVGYFFLPGQIHKPK
jgi:hypothetical protein